jgi:hypothetical protein
MTKGWRPYVRESLKTRALKREAALQRHAAERAAQRRKSRAWHSRAPDHVSICLGLGNDAEITVNGVVQP